LPVVLVSYLLSTLPASLAGRQAGVWNDCPFIDLIWFDLTRDWFSYDNECYSESVSTFFLPVFSKKKKNFQEFCYLMPPVVMMGGGFLWW
jgi:hypothetical protein